MRRTIVALGFAGLLAACAGSSVSPAASLPLATMGPGEALPTVEGSFPADHVFDIRLGQRSINMDEQPLRELTLQAGDEYLFRVTNDSGGVDHNFYIGEPGDLVERRYDRLIGIPVFGAGTAEFAYAVPAGGADLQFACTLFEHFEEMRGDIVVE